jgi:FkbM family methyltransferase
MKERIYDVLELFYNKGKKVIISGIELRLPYRFSRYYENDYEKESVTFFKKHIYKGQVVIDVGAQIGLMAKLFADLVGENGRVYAFEPTPKTFTVLKKTISLNKQERIIKPIEAAISEKKGKASFSISNQDIDAANSLSDTNRQHQTHMISVDVLSLDEFVAEEAVSKVDFIKIDAEGAEYFVLKGARTILKEYRPIINLALHPKSMMALNSTLKQVYDFIMEENYAIYSNNKEISEAVFTSQENLFDVQLIPR